MVLKFTIQIKWPSIFEKQTSVLTLPDIKIHKKVVVIRIACFRQQSRSTDQLNGSRTKKERHINKNLNPKS